MVIVIEQEKKQLQKSIRHGINPKMFTIEKKKKRITSATLVIDLLVKYMSDTYNIFLSLDKLEIICLMATNIIILSKTDLKRSS